MLCHFVTFDHLVSFTELLTKVLWHSLTSVTLNRLQITSYPVNMMNNVAILNDPK